MYFLLLRKFFFNVINKNIPLFFIKTLYIYLNYTDKRYFIPVILNKRTVMFNCKKIFQMFKYIMFFNFNYYIIRYRKNKIYRDYIIIIS